MPGAEFMPSDHELHGAAMVHSVEIPVIDMSSNNAGSRMVQASMEWGIFQVVNHGVPASAMSELQRVGREFFALPQEEKQRHAIDPSSGKAEGYGSTLKRDIPGGMMTWSEFLFHNLAPPSAVDHAVWPQKPNGYREANEAYFAHLHTLTRRLFEGLSAGLGLEEGAMEEAFGGDDVVFLQKINFYPPCPHPELAHGVAPHTDLSTLTVLMPNEVPGLQVSRDERWYDVKYVPGAIIVHIGDQIEASFHYAPRTLVVLDLCCYVSCFYMCFSVADSEQREVQSRFAPDDGEQREDADVVAGVRRAADGARRRAAPADRRQRGPGQV
jgi:flavonol synthase